MVQLIPLLSTIQQAVTRLETLLFAEPSRLRLAIMHDKLAGSNCIDLCRIPLLCCTKPLLLSML